DTHGRRERCSIDSGEWEADLTLSPDGRRLAVGPDTHRLRWWDTATGRELPPLAGLPIQFAGVPGFSPDGRLLALPFRNSSRGSVAVVWDTATGREAVPSAGHADAVLCLAYAPGGKVLATGGSDGSVRLWDPATGQELRRLGGHQGYVSALA